MAAQREFEFNDKHFNTLRTLVSKHTGIHLSDAKRELVYSRISRRLRKLGMRGFDAYCSMLESNTDDEELVNFVNAVTTNLTSFFREGHHFTYLGDEVLPRLVEKNQASRRIRIWSAGCSTGEEPYSIAITVLEKLGHLRDWDIRILATDIDSDVVATGRAGIYAYERIEGLDKKLQSRWFKQGKGEQTGLVRVDPALQALISFRQLNLMQEWPIRGPFDVIFCRNVVIYFDKETQRVLFDRYANLLGPEGNLFIGHSENLFKVSDRFELIGRTIYKRIN